MLPTKTNKTVMQMLLEKASKLELMRSFNTISLLQIIEGNYPCIAVLEHKYGLEKTEKALKILTLDLTAAFADDCKLMVDELVVELSTSYRNLSLEDVYFVFKELKAKPIYGKLNNNKVLKEFKEYWDKRLDAADEYNYNKHLSTKQPFGERTNKTTEIARHKEAFKQYYLGKK